MEPTSLPRRSVPVRGPWSPITWLVTAARKPLSSARCVARGAASYRGTYALELTFAEVDQARESLTLLRRAAVNAGRWSDLRQLDGAAKLLERSVEAHHRAASARPEAA